MRISNTPVQTYTCVYARFFTTLRASFIFFYSCHKITTLKVFAFSCITLRLWFRLWQNFCYYNWRKHYFVCVEIMALFQNFCIHLIVLNFIYYNNLYIINNCVFPAISADVDRWWGGTRSTSYKLLPTPSAKRLPLHRYCSILSILSYCHQLYPNRMKIYTEINLAVLLKMVELSNLEFCLST